MKFSFIYIHQTQESTRQKEKRGHNELANQRVLHKDTAVQIMKTKTPVQQSRAVRPNTNSRLQQFMQQRARERLWILADSFFLEGMFGFISPLWIFPGRIRNWYVFVSGSRRGTRREDVSNTVRLLGCHFTLVKLCRP